MDTTNDIQIIEALANGIDPVSGEVFPQNSPYQDVQITRALFHALELLKKQKSGPVNQGAKWTMELDNELKELYQNGAKVAELAKKYQRTSGAIRSRLAKFGLIDQFIPQKKSV